VVDKRKGTTTSSSFLQNQNWNGAHQVRADIWVATGTCTRLSPPFFYATWKADSKRWPSWHTHYWPADYNPLSAQTPSSSLEDTVQGELVKEEDRNTAGDCCFVVVVVCCCLSLINTRIMQLSQKILSSSRLSARIWLAEIIFWVEGVELAFLGRWCSQVRGRKACRFYRDGLCADVSEAKNKAQ
jgi:hypothetical protein